MAEKIAARRGISALHVWEPIAGLRSPGKGANRTILDWLFCPWGRGKSGLSAAAGHAGAGSLPKGLGRFRLDDPWGGSAGCSLERVRDRDDSVFGGSSDTP